MERLTVTEQREFGLAPAVNEEKKLQGLLLTAEGIATAHCPSAQNAERVYTERMRFAIYTLARAINASFAADPANNVISESAEGYSYSLSEVDYTGNKVVAGALRLVDFACHTAEESGIGVSVKGRRPCACHGDEQ